jgi:hypothetical protein
MVRRGSPVRVRKRALRSCWPARAIAVAEVDGAEVGLALVDRLDHDGYQYFRARFLQRRMAEVGASPPLLVTRLRRFPGGISSFPTKTDEFAT